MVQTSPTSWAPFRRIASGWSAAPRREPARLASMTLELMTRHRIDPRGECIAGLSGVAPWSPSWATSTRTCTGRRKHSRLASGSRPSPTTVVALAALSAAPRVCTMTFHARCTNGLPLRCCQMANSEVRLFRYRGLTFGGRPHRARPVLSPGDLSVRPARPREKRGACWRGSSCRRRRGSAPRRAVSVRWADDRTSDGQAVLIGFVKVHPYF